MNFIYNIISEELIYALGWTVIHSIWQAMIIALIMALIMPTLQKKSAKYRYELAGMALFMVLVTALSTFVYMYDQSTESLASMTILISGEASGIVASQSFLNQSAQTCASYFNEHLPLIVMLWLVGVSAFLLKLLGGLAYIQYLKNNYQYPLSDEWQQKLTAIAQKIPVRRTIKFAESALVKVPMVFGIFKPMILLPIGAINNLTAKEVEAIIAHEVAHIYRNDYLLNILFSFIEIIFYFNPAVWWISANVRMERENCCDDVAIAVCGDSLSYAKALLSLQEISAPSPSLAMSFSGNKKQLLSRVKRILNQPQNKSNIMEKLVATSLFLFAIISLSFSTNDNTQITDAVTPIEHIEITEEPTVTITTVATDTIPTSNKKQRQRIVKKTDNESVEMVIEDGEITELKIDDIQIPKEEYEDYEDLTRELTEELKTPPTPPMPPSPPTPVFPGAIPAPPAPPSPPVPPVPVFERNTTQKIKTEQNEDGNTVISIESNGSEPMEIIINEEKAIYIDGKKVEAGDSLTLKKHGFSFIDGNKNIFFLDNDADILALNGNAFPMNLEDLDVSILESEYFEDIGKYFEGGNFKLKGNATFDNVKGREDLLKMIEEAKLNQEKILEEAYFNLDINREKLYADQERMFESLAEAKEKRAQALEDIHIKLKKDKDGLREWTFTMQSNGEEKQLRSAIENQLLSDGLISSRNQYQFELDHKKLKINGKRQSKEYYKKYKKIYSKLTGQDKGKFRYQIKIDGNNNNVSRSF